MFLIQTHNKYYEHEYEHGKKKESILQKYIVIIIIERKIKQCGLTVAVTVVGTEMCAF